MEDRTPPPFLVEHCGSTLLGHTGLETTDVYTVVEIEDPRRQAVSRTPGEPSVLD